jgi:tetratricopeptide (TPR) repeat protein
MNVEALEKAISAAPGVRDCGIVRDVDVLGRERFLALIVTRDDWDDRRFVEHCERTIAREFLPWNIVRVSAIPRGNRGRADRLALAQLGARAISLGAEEAATLQGGAEASERERRFGEAANVYFRLLAADPAKTELYAPLGRLLLKLGSARDAIKVLEEAIRHSPESAAVLTDLGAAHAMLGDHRRAVACYERAIATDPEFAPALIRYGKALIALERYAEAETALSEAVRLDPKSADAHVFLGDAVSHLLGPFDAIPHFERAIACEPRHLEANFHLGVALRNLGQPAEAIERFNAVIEAAPDAAQAHDAIGVAMQVMGRPEEATRHFEKAVALSPRDGWFLRHLAEATPPEESGPLLSRISALLAEGDAVPAFDRVHMLAALSAAEDRARAYDRAFQFAIEANNLARTTYQYDPRDTVETFENVRKAFSKQLMSAPRDHSQFASESPLFVVGMPRSGTTLIEHILASHPDVHGAGELDHLAGSIAKLGIGAFGTRDFFVSLPSVTGRRLAEAGHDYILRSARLAPQATIVSKALTNFYRAGLINLMLPNAKIIHITRDALDTCVSRYMSVFLPGNPYSHVLAELGDFHKRYEILMQHWRESLPAGVMIDVSYESLVTDPEPEIRRVLQHCGLAWNESCLNFHQSARAVTTPTRRQVRQPAYQSSIGRWRRYEKYIKPLVTALGGKRTP